VESASLAATVPFGMTSFGKNLRPADGPADAKRVSAAYNIVTADYFQTMGIPLLRGRAFLPGEKAAIVDRLAADRLWPGQDALGKRLRAESDDPGRPVEDLPVVGVVGNLQDHILGKEQQPHFYAPFGAHYQSNMQLHLKTPPGLSSDAQARLVAAVREAIRGVDANLPVLTIRTMRDHLDGSFDLWVVRMGAQMLAIFGSVALLLAVVGLYGVKAYAVAQRTREIGIRMALGADPSDTQRLILREGFQVTMVGVGAGMLLALGLGRILAAMLWDVRPADPVVFLMAPLLLTVVAFFACYLPARRAARVDPMVALRYE
jgi:putative ABC transport system permease protein